MSTLTKLCPKCGRKLLLSEFHKNKQAKDGRQSKCKECNKTAVQSWQKENPDYWLTQKNRSDVISIQRRARTYGITLEQAEKMMKTEGCEICGASFEETKPNFDHDHKTGKIRGVLCGPHNRALGIFNDDIDLLRAAIEYLKKHS